MTFLRLLILTTCLVFVLADGDTNGDGVVDAADVTPSDGSDGSVVDPGDPSDGTDGSSDGSSDVVDGSDDGSDGGSTPGVIADSTDGDGTAVTDDSSQQDSTTIDPSTILDYSKRGKNWVEC
jgi:hypothetical protein